MIPYEDLCSALEAFAVRTRGVSPSHADESAHARGRYGDAHAGDPATGEAPLPHEPTLISRGDDGTHVGGEPAPLEPVYDLASSELDVSDAMPDDE